MSNNRIEWLDLVRGLAAIIVVLFHFQGYLGIRGLDFGFLAVQVFFILSGIVLSVKYTDAIEGGMTFAQFAGIRLRRLYPMVFVAGCFILAMNAAHVAPAFHQSDRYAWLVFLVLPLPSHWPAAQAFPADGPMWSLWAELVANAVWFAVIRLGRRWMPWFGGAAFLLLLLLTLHHKTLGDGWQQSASMLTFAVVSALAWFSVGYAIGTSRSAPVARPPILLAGFVAVLVLLQRGTSHPWMVELVAVLISALLLHALLHAPRPPRSVARLALGLGALSYPLYLIHLPAGRLLQVVDVAMPHWAAFVLVIGLAAAGATWLNEWVVDHLRKARRRPSRLVEGVDAGSAQAAGATPVPTPSVANGVV